MSLVVDRRACSVCPASCHEARQATQGMECPGTRYARDHGIPSRRSPLPARVRRMAPCPPRPRQRDGCVRTLASPTARCHTLSVSVHSFRDDRVALSERHCYTMKMREDELMKSAVSIGWRRSSGYDQRGFIGVINRSDPRFETSEYVRDRVLEAAEYSDLHRRCGTRYHDERHEKIVGRMPQRDGYAFVSAVRQRGCTTPSAAFTALARTEDRTRALQAGYQTHIVNPAEPSELLITVAALAHRTAASTRGAKQT